MTSKIVVNNIEADAGISTVTFASEVTAPTFNGNIVGTSATFSGNVNVAGVLTYEDVTSVDAVGLSTFQNGIHVTGGNIGVNNTNPQSQLHVTNSSTSTVSLMEDGASGADLVYDGSTNYFSIKTGTGGAGSQTTRLTIQRDNGNIGINTEAPAAKLNVVTTSTDDAILMLEADMGTNNNRVLQFKSPATDSGADPFLIQTGNSIQFRIDSTDALKINDNGKVGIGTDNPDEKLEVYGGKIFIDGGGNRKITLDPGSNTTYDSRIDASHGLVFRSYVDAGAGVKTCTFDTNGDLDLTQGRNIKFASGHGIDFSVTDDGGNGSTRTSEVLDDYEEGTWTPDLRFAGSNTGVSYSWRNGHYTKIGRQVTVRGAFGLSSRGTFNATDDAFIYGLPFDVAPYNITGGFNYTFGSAYNGYQGLFQIETQYSASFSDHVPLSRQTAWNSAVSPMEYQDIGGSQRMAFIFTYFTAS